MTRYAKNKQLSQTEIVVSVKPPPKSTKSITHSCCCLCNGLKENISYVNCEKKGLQNIAGKYGMKECMDKPVCNDCCELLQECPFCTVHQLVHFRGGKGPKRKRTFAVAEARRQKKSAKKKLLAQKAEESRRRKIIKLERERKKILWRLWKRDEYILLGYHRRY